MMFQIKKRYLIFFFDRWNQQMNSKRLILKKKKMKMKNKKVNHKQIHQ